MPTATVPQPNIGLVHLFFGIKYGIAEVAEAFRQTGPALREEAARVHEAIHRADLQLRSANQATFPGKSIPPALSETPVLAPVQSVSTVPAQDAPNPALLPDALREVWDYLEGRVAAAKEIAIAFGLGPAGDVAIVQRVYALRKRGFRIQTGRGAGYYRTDAPPVPRGLGTRVD